MRVVRVPANRPAIAAVSIGRGAAPASTAGPVASVGAPEPAPDGAPPSPAAAKKPQKTAQNRRREAPAWREVRADAWSAFAYEHDRPRGIPFSPFW